MRALIAASLAVPMIIDATASAAVMQYGDKDVLNTGDAYPIDPTTGATLEGLAPGAVTVGAPAFDHIFPFDPEIGDHPGTDQIYVGSTQTTSWDGYADHATRMSAPQVIEMDYASLIPAGEVLATLTLGIAFDDFQFTVWGQPFLIWINGVENAVITDTANGLNQTGPKVQFFSFGIDPAVLSGDHILTLTIDQGGDGGDGWAIDFLTVGVTTIPAPATSLLLLAGAGAAIRRRG